MKTLTPPRVLITALDDGDDVVLMGIQSVCSLGSQLAANYDRPRYNHGDGFVSAGRWATVLAECLNALSVCLCQYIYVWTVCGYLWVCVNVSLLS